MTQHPAADELRAAAATLRTWIADETPGRWAPSAVAAFGPDLADRLDSAAADAERGDADPHALAVARDLAPLA